MCLAIPTQIKAINQNTNTAQAMATVVLGGVEREVSLIMTPEAQVGDYVLIHAGYAINVLDYDEAQASLAAFEELAAIQEALEA